ncbi:cytochrome P450 monooxygenase-like protein [Karstenula rhodostoma CBS 690.94]|uniref:Cytochrome P450 monooxygenase-like protein n=1 Tax=Karstenula rhodostoma CBS 690.94 TaxID=1392251 RepID=A0A9P4PNG1_9PLEO|nr:cytochrome P450 monooxygenase-like protein [Karstenula rhodostoma CBS 690.94]
MMSSTTLRDEFRLLSPVGIAFSFGALLSIVALYSLYTCIYNLYFHPLSHIPGPFWARATPIPYILHIKYGTMVPWIHEIHQKYGDVVRINPSECSFISGETAWQDIYGFRTGRNKGGDTYQKDLSWYPVPFNGSKSIISANDADHSRMRKNLSHAFSDRALRGQERIVQDLVDLLIQRLDERIEGNAATDIMLWYNYTTFDIISDLTFGEPLGCLRERGYHPWVDLLLGLLKAQGIMATRNKYPLVAAYDRLVSLFSDNSAALRARLSFGQGLTAKVKERLEAQTPRADFFSEVIKNQGIGEKALSRGEMVTSGQALLAAGSETTATLLSGVTFLMLKNPDIYTKLVQEIRGRFTSAEQITFAAVEKLEYTIAVLQEALRYYPPVPTGFPRVAPKGGDTVSGRYIPGGTAVYVSQHATNHSARNFAEPDAFVPERWLKDTPEKFKQDNRAAMNPFSFGPRNCIGKNLAYAEMRVILAKVIWHFDLELMPGMDDWLERHKLFMLWEKPALMVRLRRVVR